VSFSFAQLHRPFFQLGKHRFDWTSRFDSFLLRGYCESSSSNLLLFVWSSAYDSPLRVVSLLQGLVMALIVREFFWVPKEFQWGILIMGGEFQNGVEEENLRRLISPPLLSFFSIQPFRTGPTYRQLSLKVSLLDLRSTQLRILILESVSLASNLDASGFQTLAHFPSPRLFPFQDSSPSSSSSTTSRFSLEPARSAVGTSAISLRKDRGKDSLRNGDGGGDG